MTVQLKLPESMQRRLLADVRAGRHATLQDAILDRIHRGEEFLSIAREARSKSFAEIMAPVRKQSPDANEAEIVRLVERARGGKRPGKASRRDRSKR